MNNSEEPNISLYGNQDGVEDFPVLKAFQQYIDAEQAKARRRLLTLGIFFGVVLTAVIIIFAIMLSSASSRVQDLNDRLIEFAMKERAAGSANQANDAAFKAMTDTMAMLQREIKDRRAEAPSSAAESPSAAGVDMAAAARLKREQEALEREKKRLEMEKESVYQQTLELQRRRLYPQYYAEEEAPPRRTRSSAAKAKAKRRVVEEEPDDEDEDLYLDDLEDDDDDNSGVDEDGNLKPIDYFKGDSYEIPVEAKGRGTGKWHVPSK